MATRWPWRVCQLVSSVAMKESLLWEQRSPRGKAQQVAPSLRTRGVPGDKNGHPHPGQRLGPSELVRAYPREWAGQSPLLRRPPKCLLGGRLPQPPVLGGGWGPQAFCWRYLCPTATQCTG